MAVTYEQARDVAEAHLRSTRSDTHLPRHPDNPFSPPTETEPADVAILESRTIENDLAWIFFYQSKAYIKTGDVRDMLGGNAPLIVIKDTGELYETGAAASVEEYLGDLADWLRIKPRLGMPPADMEVCITMTPTAEGGRHTPAFSGYRPHFTLREDWLTSGVIELVDADEIGPGESGIAKVTVISVCPQSVWIGRVLKVQEGARLVGLAEVRKVFNPMLKVEEPMYELLLGGEVLGRSALENRDRSMGIAHGKFRPTFAFKKVESVFALFADSQDETGIANEAQLREYYQRRDQLDLRLRSPEGAMIPIEVVHIVDCRAELGEDTCEIEVYPLANVLSG